MNMAEALRINTTILRQQSKKRVEGWHLRDYNTSDFNLQREDTGRSDLRGGRRTRKQWCQRSHGGVKEGEEYQEWEVRMGARSLGQTLFQVKWLKMREIGHVNKWGLMRGLGQI